MKDIIIRYIIPTLMLILMLLSPIGGRLQADGDYVTLCTAKGNFLKEQTMKYFQRVLPTERFVRIHRSYIVNIAQISSIDSQGKETYYVVLKNGASLRVSVSGYQELKQKLDI